MAVVAENTGITLRSFRGSTSRRRKERIVHGLFAGAAGLSLLISAAIILALLEKAIVFLTKVPLGAALDRAGGSLGTNQFDLPTIIIGTLAIAVVAMAVADPGGSRGGDLPGGVLGRTAPPDPEAHHRDACRRAERRHGLLRAQRDQPRLREEALLGRRHVQPAGRRHRCRHPDGAAGGIRRRGRDVRRPRRAPGGGVRDRRASAERDDEGRVPRRGIRASRRP